MTSALSDMELAAQALATAFTTYMTAYQTIARAAHPDANRQQMLDLAVGSALPGLLVRRLRALGLGAVLDKAKTSGTLAADWSQALQVTIRGLVP